MLEQVLRKLNVSSAAEYFIKRREFMSKYDGLEIEVTKSPLDALTEEELTFFNNYVNDHWDELGRQLKTA